MSSSETQEPDLDNASVGRVHFEKISNSDAWYRKISGIFFVFRRAENGRKCTPKQVRFIIEFTKKRRRKL